MNDDYKELHKEAEHLWFKFRDIVDMPNDGAMQSMLRELKEIVEVIESNRAPRMIEDRIREAQRELARLRSAETGLMTPDDADTLFRGYEKLREHIRELPNY